MIVPDKQEEKMSLASCFLNTLKITVLEFKSRQ